MDEDQASAAAQSAPPPRSRILGKQQSRSRSVVAPFQDEDGVRIVREDTGLVRRAARLPRPSYSTYFLRGAKIQADL
jgi:hypothetical protein